MKGLVLAEVHAGAQIWTRKSPRIIILKAVCRFVVLLLSTFYSFFHFCRGFYLCHFATLPIIVPPSSTLQWAIEIKKKVSSMGYFSREIFILRYWRQDQWNLRLSAHRRNHDSTLDWMLWESEKVFNFRYNEMQSLFPIVMKLRKKREEPKLYSI